jgi:DNA polymerase-4
MATQGTPPPSPPRRIAHLDMDAFYASVELLRYPQLRDLPVVVGGRRVAAPEATGSPAQWPLHAFARLRHYTGRGVVTTASYAARAHGVGSAMPLMQAARLCPDAILLPADFDEYRRWSRAFKAIAQEVAPCMEDRGIDEVYLDFTHVPGGQRDDGRAMARLIQRAIAEQTGLSCSLGVAPNKLLAKMASDMQKPGGITVLQPHDLRTHVWPMPCRKVHGIGPKASERLQQHGIHTIGELAAQPLPWLRAEFGASHGQWLHDAAWGRDDRPVQTHSEPVSMSRETTFEEDLHPRHHKAALGEHLDRLCHQLALDLQRKGYVGKTIGIKLRYRNFEVITRDQTLAQPVAAAGAIRHAATQCLRRADLSRSLRLLGVRVANLQRPTDAAQPNPNLALF